MTLWVVEKGGRKGISSGLAELLLKVLLLLFVMNARVHFIVRICIYCWWQIIHLRVGWAALSWRHANSYVFTICNWFLYPPFSSPLHVLPFAVTCTVSTAQYYTGICSQSACHDTSIPMLQPLHHQRCKSIPPSQVRRHISSKGAHNIEVH